MKVSEMLARQKRWKRRSPSSTTLWAPKNTTDRNWMEPLAGSGELRLADLSPEDHVPVLAILEKLGTTGDSASAGRGSLVRNNVCAEHILEDGGEKGYTGEGIPEKENLGYSETLPGS